jgi:thiamine biosynthesis lipoprotein
MPIMHPSPAFLCARLLPVALALWLWSPLALAQWLGDEQAIMGTAIQVELWHEDRAAGEAAIAAVMAEMRRIDNSMSPFIATSELSRINDEAALHPVVISQEMFDLIARSLALSKRTGGAFDITFSSVGFLYDYRRHIKPSEADIQRALPGVNYRHIILDRAASTIRFDRPGVRIDLGGIAKGHAVDSCIGLLQQRGITHALVTAGGDSRIIGDRRGRPWMIGVRDPLHKEDMVAVLPLSDTAVSTSGDYERYFEADGVRYHHILNPKTGHSASEVHSATIIAADATTTDGLSTSVFVLGPKKGMALVESLSGVEAVIVDKKGRLLYSRGLRRPEGPVNSPGPARARP